MWATIAIALLIFGYIGVIIYRRVTKKSSGCGCSESDCPIKSHSSDTQ
ncbi:FeoB-associated Cys-rich membrane protein [Vagococcus elongatus]|uniref:FeoB-associated Cys-rich membrane protein n=1 Tax=Vagococcus elongatus TaxID=180344 RepID=A0A430B4F2_9ENTE|nr:FeoB-associated Cys-rich membrane protein [Vagococcus elongatus]RSU15194.1 hypothetical protein CBF29_02345 [Vagococcus elongatus]